MTRLSQLSAAKSPGPLLSESELVDAMLIVDGDPVSTPIGDIVSAIISVQDVADPVEHRALMLGLLLEDKHLFECEEWILILRPAGVLGDRDAIFLEYPE